MDATLWAPAGWRYLHGCSLSFPENPTPQQQEDYRRFFTLVGPTLPCPVCRSHWNQMVTATPPDVESREKLVTWLIDRHNDVNAVQGKPRLSYDEAMRSILQRDVRRNDVVGIAAGLVVVLGVCLILFMARRAN